MEEAAPHFEGGGLLIGSTFNAALPAFTIREVEGIGSVVGSSSSKEVEKAVESGREGVEEGFLR